MADETTSEPIDHFPKGTGRPAAGAFFAAGYTSLDSLAGASESALARLHGVGPKALQVVKEALDARGSGLAP